MKDSPGTLCDDAFFSVGAPGAAGSSNGFQLGCGVAIPALPSPITREIASRCLPGRRLGNSHGFASMPPAVRSAYGDFLSYCLVAEGAADIAAEPEVSVWDLAALDILVREAGGAFISLDGTAGPHGGSAVATNGLLHQQVLS